MHKDHSTKDPRKKVLLDVDTGVDDAIGIIVAATAPEIELLGITTVSGNIDLASATVNTLRVLKLLGKEGQIPVHMGASKPLHRSVRYATEVHGATGLSGQLQDIAVDLPKGQSAEDFMIETIDQYPGEITLIMTAPQTNFAKALEKRPDLGKQLKEIIFMGGVVDGRGNESPRAEFNIAIDPEAAERVVHCGAKITMVGLDVTKKALLKRSDLGVTEGNLESDADADTKDQVEANAEAQIDANSKSSAESNTKANAKSSAKASAKASGKASAESNTKANAKDVAEANSQGDAETEANFLANADILADADAKADPNDQDQVKADADTDANNPIIDFVKKVTAAYMNRYHATHGVYACLMHDPLAVSLAIQPDFVKTRHHFVGIETNSTYCDGETVCDFKDHWMKERNVHVALELDSGAFIDFLVDRIRKAGDDLESS